MKEKLTANFYIIMCVILLTSIAITKGVARAGECTAGNIGRGHPGGRP